ncbi:hypothetical protein ADINL_2989 [Nitrincola lacisaponensis]|uniref:Uncharacterized protein n=1 Tax=Nitrincola lacisaponensis TaxID=267850 RepID=A0A063XYG5_9GAMM|nr:hypothetical protein ADINL_2989 [Nitrincola lacisaponensis]
MKGFSGFGFTFFRFCEDLFAVNPFEAGYSHFISFQCLFYVQFFKIASALAAG